MLRIGRHWITTGACDELYHKSKSSDHDSLRTSTVQSFFPSALHSTRNSPGDDSSAWQATQHTQCLSILIMLRGVNTILAPNSKEEISRPADRESYALSIHRVQPVQATISSHTPSRPSLMSNASLRNFRRLTWLRQSGTVSSKLRQDGRIVLSLVSSEQDI
jgi:hypothetical protein